MAGNLYQLLQDAWQASSTGEAKVFGVEVALVTNVKDPDKLGRVKICYPRFPGKPESDWARVVQPAAGDGRGFYWLPEVNDEVLVAFERGEAHKPYVIGSLWNGKDAPMKDAYADENHIRMIQTKSGHQILLSDKDGEEKITIGDKSGKRTLTFDVKEKKLLIEAGIGDIEIKAEKKIVLECEDLEIKTKKSGKIDIGDTFDLVVKDKAGLKAGPAWTWKAQQIEINPSGGAGFGGLAALAWKVAKALAAAAAAGDPGAGKDSGAGGSASPGGGGGGGGGGGAGGGAAGGGGGPGGGGGDLSSDVAPAAPPASAAAAPPGGAPATPPATTPAALPATTPGTTPASTPGTTPASTPGTTPASTPGTTPASTPGTTPASTPGTTPASTPGTTPASTPGTTPASTPGTTPASTPGTTPASTPGTTPASTPGTTPASTPGTTPGAPKGTPPASTPASTPPASAPATTPSDTPLPADAPPHAEIFPADDGHDADAFKSWGRQLKSFLEGRGQSAVSTPVTTTNGWAADSPAFQAILSRLRSRNEIAGRPTLNTLAIFCHGESFGVGVGINKHNLDTLATELRAHADPNQPFRVCFFACMTGASSPVRGTPELGTYGDQRGNGGLAEATCAALMAQGFTKVQVDGHFTYGVGSSNPNLRRFYSEQMYPGFIRTCVSQVTGTTLSASDPVPQIPDGTPRRERRPGTAPLAEDPRPGLFDFNRPESPVPDGLPSGRPDQVFQHDVAPKPGVYRTTLDLDAPGHGFTGAMHALYTSGDYWMHGMFYSIQKIWSDTYARLGSVTPPAGLLNPYPVPDDDLPPGSW